MSPDWKARAKNTACAVFLAGPPVTAALQPLVGWSLVSQLWPEPVKVGGGASVLLVLSAVDFGGVFTSVRVDRRRQHARRMTESFLPSVRQFLHQCDRFEGSSVTGLRGALAFVTGLCVKFAWRDRFVTGFQRFVRAFAAGESEPVTRLRGVRQSHFGV